MFDTSTATVLVVVMGVLRDEFEALHSGLAPVEEAAP